MKFLRTPVEVLLDTDIPEIRKLTRRRRKLPEWIGLLPATAFIIIVGYFGETSKFSLVFEISIVVAIFSLFATFGIMAIGRAWAEGRVREKEALGKMMFGKDFSLYPNEEER